MKIYRFSLFKDDAIRLVGKKRINLTVAANVILKIGKPAKDRIAPPTD